MKARIMASIMIWLAAVMSVAGIAWLAIGTAGRQVTASPVAAPLPTEFPPTPASLRPSPSRTSAPGRTLMVDDVGPTPAGAGSQSGSASTRTTGPVATTTNPRPDRERRPRPGFSPVTSTYNTAAGRLRVRCDGQRITLEGGYAQPAPGWGVSVQTSGPDRIQVTFDAGKNRPITVVAQCTGGRPQFSEAAAPEASPRNPGGGWHFTGRQPAPTAPATPTIPAASPSCEVAPSPIGSPVSPPASVTVTPTESATVVPSETVTPTVTATATADPAPPAECPQVETTSTEPPAVTPTMSPEAAQAWVETWGQREWAARNR